MCGIFELSEFSPKMWKKIRFKFEISNKIYKGFPCKKSFLRVFFGKWTHIKSKGNSFVQFSAGGPRSNYKGIINGWSVGCNNRRPRKNTKNKIQRSRFIGRSVSFFELHSNLEIIELNTKNKTKRFAKRECSVSVLVCNCLQEKKLLIKAKTKKKQRTSGL